MHVTSNKRATQDEAGAMEAFDRAQGNVPTDTSKTQTGANLGSESLPASEIMTRWLGKLRAGGWIAVLPVFILSFVRQLSGWKTRGLSWWYFSSLAEIVQGALLAGLIFLAGLLLFARRSSARWFLVPFVGVMSLAEVVDWSLIIHGKTRLTKHLAYSMKSGATGVLGYVDFEFLVMTVAVIAIYGLSAVIFVKERTAMRGKAAMLAALCICAFAIFQPANLIRRGVGLATLRGLTTQPGTVRDKVNSHYLEARRFSNPPLVNFVASFFGSGSGIVVSDLAKPTARLLAQYRGSDVPAPIEGGAMRRIVLITMESMSMTLTSRYNTQLGGVLTPTIDSLPQSMSNLRSVGLPTQYGLATHICSHPNGLAVITAGHPNAVPKYLVQAGWKTRFMQSASLQFQVGYRRFAEMGYQEMVGRDEFASDPRYSDYISGWGLCDRKVFDAAVEWLDSVRDQKVFLHILTADTHTPAGRDYGTLQYPETPEWIRNTGAQQPMLESWFRADYDLGLLLSQMRARGLLDENTAVIVTGDHCYLPTNVYLTLPGAGQSRIERIPWILVSGRQRLKLDLGRIASQVDTAPTIANLAGLAPLKGWWGRSLLAPAENLPLLAWRDRDVFQIEPNGEIGPADSQVSQAARFIAAGQPASTSGFSTQVSNYAGSDATTGEH